MSSTTTEHQIHSRRAKRATQFLWVTAVLLNLIVYLIGMVIAYQQAFESYAQYDIRIELVPDAVYSIRSQYRVDDSDEEIWRVTEVGKAAAEAGLQVGDLMRPHWGQGLENMPITITIQSENGETHPVTLIASYRDEGYIATSISPDARAAGIQQGDILYGDMFSDTGEIGSEIPIMVIHEGEITPETVTYIYRSNRFMVRVLDKYGVSDTVAALLDVSLTAIVVVLAFVMAIFVFAHRSDNWMALLFAWILTLAPSVVAHTNFIPAAHSGANWNLFSTITGSVALACMLIFPTGRAYPRWSLLLSVALLGMNTIPPGLPGSGLIWNALIFILLMLVIRYRYRQIFTPIQRQQAKWVLYAFSLVVLTQVILIPPIFLQGVGAYQLDALYFLIFERFGNTGLMILGIIFIAFAILRHRLYDIDIVINRSLVGASVTGVLAIVFAVSVFVIQRVTGADNTLIAFITSAIGPAVLFNPTRKRVRHFIDRRVYGLAFDLNELQAAHRQQHITNPGTLSGTTLGDYTVLDVIGKGGMGEIYKGEGNGETIAIKTMLPEIAADPTMHTRFMREAEIGQTLDHPGIAKVYTTGDHNGTPYMVMEYINGGDISKPLKLGEKYDTETATTIMQQVCGALDVAHQRGYVHRDIKPSNIMLRENGAAVLMDFGVTKVGDASVALTGTGAVGTITYMAPEQIRAARDVDHRADVYALGVMLFEMLTGQQPFAGGPAQVLFAHLQQPAPDPRDLDDEIPYAMADAILTALEKDPADRHQSAGDFAAALVS